jgi:hypothetical protein
MTQLGHRLAGNATADAMRVLGQRAAQLGFRILSVGDSLLWHTAGYLLSSPREVIFPNA